LRELAKVLDVSQMTVHRLIKQYGLPDGRKRYSNGWLYCGSCHRHVHKSVALPSKLGPICPICHRKLRRKSKEVRPRSDTHD